ncbi:sorbosone dehydrogenase [Methylacidiphilum kamchatkense Kam1]|uniref:Glucose/arabinose dehydrogenase n=1 Tax=Methylacidiphilum kamchatkense Kam1 TaxID=1202785 RepID=A0A0C1V3N9_9BACT|nr:sorbosone dehydrogenase family protein [Methylacidiphilum kamchatkense]KIE58295.1 sorbosone dehydrogenase [Methylacidiphilum kamchatkense Kam1]QDQ42307.1 glucose/arabinose dehydrogenase [Methylacidiphilum kamchatkense Kam1]
MNAWNKIIVLFFVFLCLLWIEKTHAILISENMSPQKITIDLQKLPKPVVQGSNNWPQIVPPPAKATLHLPPGFKVNIYAKDLDNPRWLALTPTGDVLVAESYSSRIMLLEDNDKDGVVDKISIFADISNGLHLPFGMVFSKDSFYVANTDGVLVFPYKEGQKKLEGRGRKILSLPGSGNHWSRTLALSPDGQVLFVTVGSKTNVDEDPPPRASIVALKIKSNSSEIYARGLRNPVGLAFYPHSSDLYVTVNERDWLGDDLVPDYLTRVEKGEFYGWPYCYLSPEFIDPRWKNRIEGTKAKELIQSTKTPDVLFQSHSAALGLAFPPPDSNLPEHYKNGAFVAFHGSWNRKQATGYKIVFVPFGENHRPKGYYEDFLTGFLLNPYPSKTWGRPCGLLFLPDGSLLLADDGNNIIYRIFYAQ